MLFTLNSYSLTRRVRIGSGDQVPVKDFVYAQCLFEIFFCATTDNEDSFLKEMV